MWLTRLKWMAIGVGLAIGGVVIYNNRDAIRDFTGSSKNGVTVARINPEFAGYISAFTTGYISSGSTIKIKLSTAFANTELNTALKEKYFSFEPEIKGETVWKDAQTLEFRPAERLKQGETYKAVFHLDKLVDVKKELRDFEFVFQTIRQSMSLQCNELKTYSSSDYNFYNVAGLISTADMAEAGLIEQSLGAHLSGSNLHLKWLHNDAGTEHRFLIDSIRRPASGNGELVLDCNGKALGLDYTHMEKKTVPGKGVFSVLSARVVNESDQYLLVTFSNPIDASQSLEGLVSCEGMNEVRYIVNENQVLVYPANAKAGAYTLKVLKGVKDTGGRQLELDYEYSLVIEEVKPAVRFSGSGNILPSTGGLSMPFETVNLRAVDVKVIRIYENNVLQFLQNNDLDGSNSLAQVGKKVAEKRINLGITNPADFGNWKKFSLDLSSLIKSEPGAIYRVILSFRKSYSTYACLGNTADEKFEMEEIKAPEEEGEVSYYGYYYEDYYNYYDNEESDGEDYNYEDRDNPCKGYYYRQYDRTVARNILASDLGLTLKKGNDGSLFAVVNDLLTTDPLSGVTLELYDYQKQLIQSAKTNSEGQAFISTPQRAYFLLAKKDKQRAYIRLDDGASLSMSMFEVGGDAVKKGVKGFIYGERGVWRPGDSLHLNFILEDKLGTIPANHPVTFELTNPQGQVYKRLLKNKNVDGFYNFATATDKNAPTGLWNAEVKIGPNKFSKGIRIETIMPNRLKIDVQVGDNKLIVGREETTVKLHTNWLTGAKAPGLQAKVGLALTAVPTSFEKFKDYTFDDQSRRFEAQGIVLFDGPVDEEGNATFSIKPDLSSSAPGFLRAAFSTAVFEKGGAFSVDRFSLDYSPYKYYAGIKLPEGERYSGILYTNRDHNIAIATVDQTGKPVSREHLRFELYKLEWRWWWDQYEDELANYSFDDYHRPVQAQEISSRNGKASVTVNIPDNRWGRYLVRVTDLDDGHTTSMVTYFDWANWMDRDGGSENKMLSNMLSFKTDKSSYSTGEDITVSIPTPQNGRALVTIENGSRVLEAHWLETEKGSTNFKFKATAQMAPNIYVHVSLMQPHARTNDLPIRLYGVAPVTINDPESHLKPTLSMQDVLQPEQEVSIVVSEQNNREMAFTLAVVDEGLLDITRFKTPDPYNTFYAKEALGVKTWDCYDKVIGAFGADLERILSIGGDGSGTDDDGAKANRFKPMVKCFGPYHLGKGEKRTIRFKMPMYVGSVRTMLIAGAKGAYGIAEKTTPVKAPLMLLGTLPRVLSVTEEVKLPVSVFGGDKNIGNTVVKVEVNGLLQTTGGNSKSVSIGKDEEKQVVFDLKVKNQTGIAKVKITASGGGHNAVYEMELDVRNPNPYQTVTKDLWVEAGKSIKENIVPVGLPGTNSGVLELSTIPPINLDERLEYLISYPHGCIEQTTSQTFAQLYLSEVLDLTEANKNEAEMNIRFGISEISKFQLSGGAMSYWQGSTETSDWGTSYAGHFLLLAEKKGYTLPSGLKKSWISYQQNVAQSFAATKNKDFNYDVLQAYRLYVLALAEHPVLSAMNRLRESSQLSDQAKWLLAGAYAQMGQISEAEKIIARAPREVSPYTVNYYTYGSSERDMAIILDVLCLMNKKPQALDQLKKVSDFLSSKRWLSTQTTAFGLVSVANFVRKFGGASALQARCTINGKETNLGGSKFIARIPLSFQNNSAGFTVRNDGKGTLYARIVNRGKPALGEEIEKAENLSVTAVYKNMDGNVIDPQELVQGTDFLLSITVRNTGFKGELKNLALSSYIPSGWEIHNARMDDNEALLKNSAFTYQDIRDDRVFTYFDLGGNESKTFHLVLNAAYLGRYYLPALNAEAMYDASVYARTKGGWIKVVKQANGAVAAK